MNSTQRTRCSSALRLLPTWLALCLCAAPSWTACAPDVTLRRPTSFTPEQVKLTLWQDRCGLQTFFDARPFHNMVVEDRGWTEVIAPGVVQQRGVITVRVSDAQQRRQLRALLARYYRASPAAAVLWGASSYDVTVNYVRMCDRPRMARGSTVTIQVGPNKVDLAYHPCMGEYLLNRDLYRTRAAMLVSGEIKVASAGGGR